MLVTLAILFHAPVIVLVMALAWVSAWPGNRDAQQGAVSHGLARLTTLVFWIASCLFAVVFGHPDWVHLYWSVQIPLTGLFLMSGAWLDHSNPDLIEQTPAGWKRVLARLGAARGGAWIWFALSALLAALPTLLLSLDGSVQESPRPYDSIPSELAAIAKWGLGGPLPQSLEPHFEHEVERGLGYLPRSMTVPLACTFIACWTSVLFSLLACVGKLVRRSRYALRGSPLIVALAVVVLSPIAILPYGLDMGEFVPISVDGSAIWRAVPSSLQSFGPLAVLTGTAFLAWCVTAWTTRGRD